MLQRNGALFEEVRPQQFAEKKDGNGVPASSSGSCHGKVWKACKCKACVKEANNGQKISRMTKEYYQQDNKTIINYQQYNKKYQQDDKKIPSAG